MGLPVWRESPSKESAKPSKHAAQPSRTPIRHHNSRSRRRNNRPAFDSRGARLPLPSEPASNWDDFSLDAAGSDVPPAERRLFGQLRQERSFARSAARPTGSLVQHARYIYDDGQADDAYAPASRPVNPLVQRAMDLSEIGRQDDAHAPGSDEAARNDAIAARLRMTNNILCAAREAYRQQLTGDLNLEQQQVLLHPRDLEAQQRFLRYARGLTYLRLELSDSTDASATSAAAESQSSVSDPRITVALSDANLNHPSLRQLQHPSLPLYSPEYEFATYHAIYSGPIPTELQSSLTPGFAPAGAPRNWAHAARHARPTRRPVSPSESLRSWTPLSPARSPATSPRRATILPPIRSFATGMPLSTSLPEAQVASAPLRGYASIVPQRSMPPRVASPPSPPVISRSPSLHSFDGLGDRDRSPQRNEDPWATMQTTIPLDENPASASSSFTSAMASASASNLGSNAASSATSLADASGSSGDDFARFREALINGHECEESVIDTDDDYNEVVHHPWPMFHVPASPPGRAADGQHPWNARSAPTNLEPLEEERRQHYIQSTNSRPTPPYEASRRANRYVDPLYRRYARDLSERQDRPVELGGELDDMQRVIASLAQREDIPDDWWAGVGLQRHLPARLDRGSP
ncbi:MAG: hypothetical protein M1814_001481 [Vezdaea aestivalis]|nr:MAG: hypothetical protein M1814_001481 [Vezdaea aestivalis]